MRERATKALGDTRAVKPLIKKLDDEKEFIQIDAAEALGKIADPRAVEPLIKKLDSVSASVYLR